MYKQTTGINRNIPAIPHFLTKNLLLGLYLSNKLYDLIIHISGHNRTAIVIIISAREINPPYLDNPL